MDRVNLGIIADHAEEAGFDTNELRTIIATDRFYVVVGFMGTIGVTVQSSGPGFGETPIVFGVFLKREKAEERVKEIRFYTSGLTIQEAAF